MFKKIILPICMVVTCSFAVANEQSKWKNDLTPIAPSDWNVKAAAHLLDRGDLVVPLKISLS